VVTLPACRTILERLAALPEAERREVHGLHPDRAPTIVAGVVMVVEALELFGLDAIVVSDHDILRGAALEVVHQARPKGEVNPPS
jgi:exopolyphosphatase/guanosine-5'-triphosphate,3'-diphosphate pyrophosphatase